MENNSGHVVDEDQIDLPPGFRFHPLDEELISHYLLPKVLDINFCAQAIGEADLNKSEPWDLPGKAKMGDKEFYFFCIRDRKYPTGLRTNRATQAGYWKATGKDREICKGKALIGMKKTLVFYRGRAPKGEKSNWVMHEYRLEGHYSPYNLPKTAKNEWVICRVFFKSTGGKKIPISELTRLGHYGNQSSFSLPPLMDSPQSLIETRTSIHETTSHVTCFSDSIEDSKRQQDAMVDSFIQSPPPPNHFGTNCPTNFIHPMNSGHMQIPDCVSKMLLDNNGPVMKRTVKAEFLQDTGTSANMSSMINPDHGKGVYEEQDYHTGLNVGPDYFDLLWNF